MSGLDQLPERSSPRARWDVALLAMRALLQVLLLVPRLLREAVCAPRRRRDMAELLRDSAASPVDPKPPGTGR
jgi:hypothetical protein